MMLAAWPRSSLPKPCGSPGCSAAARQRPRCAGRRRRSGPAAGWWRCGPCRRPGWPTTPLTWPTRPARPTSWCCRRWARPRLGRRGPRLQRRPRGGCPGAARPHPGAGAAAGRRRPRRRLLRRARPAARPPSRRAARPARPGPGRPGRGAGRGPPARPRRRRPGGEGARDRGPAPRAATRPVPDYHRFYEPETLVPPAWSTRPRLWERAFAVAAGPPPDDRACFIHRDYHPGNTLWTGGRLTGVVDWIGGSWGRPRSTWGTCGSTWPPISAWPSRTGSWPPTTP